MRLHHGFTDSDDVFLAFGQIRDGKNLDRFLRAMVHLPTSVRLFVAGTGGSAPAASAILVRFGGGVGGCAQVCVDLRYIPDRETGDLFATADHILLTYSARFRSASGVLNAAVACRKTVLASSGSSPLRSAVEGYRLGVFVAPGGRCWSFEGALRLKDGHFSPVWTRYQSDNSWEMNARGVIDGLFNHRAV